MTDVVAVSRPVVRFPSALFAMTVFTSAALVFAVEPMVAKLVLPLLGGGPSVWNTSMAFFQASLLAGYGYAHLLQRIGQVGRQAVAHCLLVALAALALPLRVHEPFGSPSSDHPALWLLGVLTVSIGAPFAVLSATAPLVQAWRARSLSTHDGREPYGLYAASNLGSLLALLAYPVLVEPTITVRAQILGWSLAYGGFGLLLAGLGVTCIRASGSRQTVSTTADGAVAITWRQRLTWLALAAIPSSLMLGVTAHLTTDVASAPFLWVAPLALYLLTFVIAFQERPSISPSSILILQAAALTACAFMIPFRRADFLPQLGVHLSAFFLTALMCHQALVARRPPPARLTEFYLWMSLGGVVGGAFNAFLAPAIFNDVWEYPLVVALSVFARPQGDTDAPPRTWLLMLFGVICAVAAPILVSFAPPHLRAEPIIGGLTNRALIELSAKSLLSGACIAAFLSRDRRMPFLAVIVMLSIGAAATADQGNTIATWRSFFGVVRESEVKVSALGGKVRMLEHGTTLHGAQATAAPFRCRPLVYYAPQTPIGQVIQAKQAQSPALRIGAVGLGTGSVAAYVRPDDHLTFFEIDPLVIRISTDPKHFSYTTECAKGRVDYVVGDARLTLDRQPPGVFDVLLIDAFSSDAVPTHLLTVEAVRGYLSHLKPDGVVILHLSNRNLDLLGPAQAVASAAGGYALLQRFKTADGRAWVSSEDALVIGRSPAAIAAFAADRRWKPSDPTQVRPWTDDYTNLPGALWRRMRSRWMGATD